MKLALLCLLMAGCSVDHFTMVGVIEHRDQITQAPVEGAPGVAIETLPRTCVFQDGHVEKCPLKTMVKTEVKK